VSAPVDPLRRLIRSRLAERKIRDLALFGVVPPEDDADAAPHAPHVSAGTGTGQAPAATSPGLNEILRALLRR
jgi:hypothetical protein